MEVPINEDIRKYNEKLYFGLTLRQCILLVCGLAAAIFVGIKMVPIVGVANISWFCMIAVLPFGAEALIPIAGMRASQLVVMSLRYIFSRRRLNFSAENLYCNLLSKKLGKRIVSIPEFGEEDGAEYQRVGHWLKETDRNGGVRLHCSCCGCVGEVRMDNSGGGCYDGLDTCPACRARMLLLGFDRFEEAAK